MIRFRASSLSIVAVFVMLSAIAGACSRDRSSLQAPLTDTVGKPAVSSAVLPTPLPSEKPVPLPTAEILSPTQQVTVDPAAKATPAGTTTNPIVDENQLPGTTDWQEGSGFDAKNLHSEIAGFAEAVSVDTGGSLPFAISTRTAGMSYAISFYRLGWYGGDGARLIHTQTGLTGQAQGYWDYTSGGIVACPTCEVDTLTGLVDTHWQTSYTLNVPGDWVSGVYLAKLVGEQGQEAYIPFVVRNDNRPSDVLVQLPANTYQAYNNWGGKSLYPFNSSGQPTVSGDMRAVKVSFNRPIAALHPSLLLRDMEEIRFLEKNGYDVTYTTTVDVDANPASLKNHRAFISVCHDEYWTEGMRDAVEQARDAGVDLAFWGGNDVYWQARYEPDRNGNARRWLVVYRHASLDPMAITEPSRVTVRWISPPLNRPQNSLTGTIYGSQASGLPAAWVIAPSAPALLLAGTGLTPGDSVPGIVGAECDVVALNGHEPANLVVVAASPMRNIAGGTTICNSTWYQASSGAYVFNAGITDWAFALDDYGQRAPGVADTRVQTMMRNMLAAFGVQPGNMSAP